MQYLIRVSFYTFIKNTPKEICIFPAIYQPSAHFIINGQKLLIHNFFILDIL